jgi:hypothetical protein
VLHSLNPSDGWRAKDSNLNFLIQSQAVEVRILGSPARRVSKRERMVYALLFCSLFPTAARFWTDVSLSSGTVLRTDHLTSVPPDHLTAVRVVF